MTSQDKERRCAQELLAIVWPCQNFDQYMYGRDVVQIESDHEPLEEVWEFDPSGTNESPEN